MLPFRSLFQNYNLDVENHREEEDDKVESGNDVAGIVTEGQKNLFMMN